MRLAHVSLPVLAVGLITCALLERFRWFGYGIRLPHSVRHVLEDIDKAETGERTAKDRAILIVQALVFAFLVIALAFHWAPVGMIGLAVSVLATAFAGVTEEHRLGHAFQEALPFTALLVVFFGIVAVIHDQNLFQGGDRQALLAAPNAIDEADALLSRYDAGDLPLEALIEALRELAISHQAK